MSGGSMGYLYRQVADAQFALSSQLRCRFAAHLQLVAQALKQIEWVDSGDIATGAEDQAIISCLERITYENQEVHNDQR